jgi:hypothetical protein
MYIAVLAISALNLLVISGMFLLLLYDSRNRGKATAEDRQSSYLFQSKLLEKMKGIEQAHLSLSVNEQKSDHVAAPGPSENRIKAAKDRLNSGIAPDIVGRECGYSGSEMGIILASAGLNSLAPGQSAGPLQ